MLNCLKENSESKTSQLGTEIGEADFFITSQMEQKKKKKIFSQLIPKRGQMALRRKFLG